MAVLTVLTYIIGMPALLYIFDLFLNALEKSVDAANSRSANNREQR